MNELRKEISDWKIRVARAESEVEDRFQDVINAQDSLRLAMRSLRSCIGSLINKKKALDSRQNRLRRVHNQ